jgi:rare lipoprotein A
MYLPAPRHVVMSRYRRAQIPNASLLEKKESEMAENLSAVQNLVELRISKTSSDAGSPGALFPVAKLAFAFLGCAALASCASSNYSQSVKTAPQVAAATPAVVAPVIAPTVAMPPVRSKNGTDKPYVVGGKRFVPAATDSKYAAVGLASWYGADFHGRKTADGERFDMMGLTAAHKTMPLPSYARVTNMSNGTSIVVRVNDRGPYVHGRLIDLSSRAADLLQFKGAGVGKVKVEYVGRAPDKASDTKMLLATLRTDGSPAQLPGSIGNTMIADATPQPAPAVTPTLKPVIVPPLVASAEPAVVTPAPAPMPAPEAVASLNMAFTPLPPTRPRSSDGILGKSATPPALASVGQVNLAKAKLPVPPAQPSLTVQPAATAFAEPTPSTVPTVMPTAPVAASMGQ